MDNKQEAWDGFNKRMADMPWEKRPVLSNEEWREFCFKAGYDAGHSDAAKWIEIEDGLPEARGEYLTTRSNGIIAPRTQALYFFNGQWYGDSMFKNPMKFVTAWMRMPEPFTDSTDDSK